MCRFFAALATQPLPAGPYLTDLPHSLLRQSHLEPQRRQKDGWGIGYLDEEGPAILKSPRPIFRESRAFLRRAGEVRSHVLLGHIRAASNPLKIPRRQLIGLPHTQPFQHEDWLFVHNGTVNIPREVRKKLGKWGRHIKGRNDSEVLFYWVLKTVAYGRGTLAARVRRSVRELEKLGERPFYGLNWALTNGQILIALCYVGREGFGRLRALSGHGRYWQMKAQTKEGQFVVTSEALEGGKWRSFRHGEFVVVRRAGRRLRINWARL
jgi:glutamine amidotransferase